MAKRSQTTDSGRDNILTFKPCFRSLRAGVPPFDPNNEVHLRAWESMFDFGVQSLREGWEAAQ